MPYKRNYRKRPYARRKRKAPQNGASMKRPTFTRTLRVKQNLTRECRWFKYMFPVLSTPAGLIAIDVDPSNVNLLKQFQKFGTIYEEFKTLMVVLKLYPSAVGSESLNTQGPGGNLVPIYRRGDIVSWVDPTTPNDTVTQIIDVMGRPSATLFQPRRFHKRWMTRPRGYPEWASLNTDGTIQAQDTWQGSINVFGQGFTPSPAPGIQRYFYAEVSMKILFRSRQNE